PLVRPSPHRGSPHVHRAATARHAGSAGRPRQPLPGRAAGIIERGGATMTTKAQATIEDLYRVPGKAEIVNGEVVLMSPTGDDPSYASGAVFVSLWQHAE